MIKISIYQNNKKILGGITNIEENKVKEIIDSERPITTAINSTSTDTQIPSAKSVYDKSKNKIKVLTDKDILAYADSITSESVTDTVRILNGTNTPYGTDNTINDFYYTIYNIADHDGFKRIVAYDIRQNDMYMIVKSNGVWSAWQKVCTTTVADASGTATISNGASGTVSYKVINGICYVGVVGIADGLNGRQVCSITGLPKPSVYTNTSIECDGVRVGTVYGEVGTDTFIVHKVSTTWGWGSFSYPVAES